MELSELRNQINVVDDQLLTLFLQRMDLAEQVAAYKKQHGEPIRNEEREQAILDKVTRQAGDRGTYAGRFFSALMELSRLRQAELIGCLPEMPDK